METRRQLHCFVVGAPAMLLLISFLSISHTAFAVKHDINWAPGVNYTDWASHQRFYVGQWLVFYYQKGMYDVVQVNATDYEQCSAAHPIRSWDRGRSYAFELNETGRYYFICSRGYCYNGMKLSVLAEQLPAPAPAPSSPSTSGSALRRQFLSFAVAVPVVALIVGFF